MRPDEVIAVVTDATPVDEPEIDWCPCCGLYPVPGDAWRCLPCEFDGVPHPMDTGP